MTKDKQIWAFIYCRHTSSNDEGIQRQEDICRSYADKKGYQIVEVFRDNGVSGNTLERDGINELFAFLAITRGEVVVLIDEIVRIPRDIKAHYQFLDKLSANGARYEVCS